MLTKADHNKMLEHRFGGNGWAIVEWLPDNMVRLGTVDNRDAHIGEQFFTAWDKMLKPQRYQVLEDPNDPKSRYIDGDEIVLSDELQNRLYALREELAIGTRKIVNTRLIPSLSLPKQNATKAPRSGRPALPA